MARLLEDLGRYLPEEALAPLGGASLTPAVLADRALRCVAPLALEARGASEAAARVRALPAVGGAATVTTVQPALEKVARATGAPSDLVRAAAQCAGALLRLEAAGGEEAGTLQLVAAVTRLASGAIRAGVPAAQVVRELAGG